MLTDKVIKRQLSREGFTKRDYVVSCGNLISMNDKLFDLVQRS